MHYNYSILSRQREIMDIQWPLLQFNDVSNRGGKNLLKVLWCIRQILDPQQGLWEMPR